MPYVQRDSNGAVCGVYANAQEGYAEELLPEDDPEVVAFLTPPEPAPVEHSTAAEKLVAFLNSNPDVKALLGL